MKSPSPEQVPSLDPKVFADALLVGLAAGEHTGGGPVSVDQVEADGSVSVLKLPDSPFSRAGFALKRHFAGDEAVFRAALPRFRALMDLYTRGILDPWTQVRDGGRTALHPAVIDVASQMRLSANGKFAPRKFLAAVDVAVRERYRALDEWGKD